VYPYGDLGIQNLLGRVYNDGIRMKRREVVEISTRWGNQGTMVLYFLMCADVLDYMNEKGRFANS
jgi:3-methyladenine DNA glycosylase/8-oxoguanine DNA glycosylase